MNFEFLTEYFKGTIFDQAIFFSFKNAFIGIKFVCNNEIYSLHYLQFDSSQHVNTRKKILNLNTIFWTNIMGV